MTVVRTDARRFLFRDAEVCTSAAVTCEKARSMVCTGVREAAEIEAAWLERIRRAGPEGELRPVLESALREREGGRGVQAG
jgi:hypothetical protein